MDYNAGAVPNVFGMTGWPFAPAVPAPAVAPKKPAKAKARKPRKGKKESEDKEEGEKEVPELRHEEPEWRGQFGMLLCRAALGRVTGGGCQLREAPPGYDSTSSGVSGGEVWGAQGPAAGTALCG